MQVRLGLRTPNYAKQLHILTIDPLSFQQSASTLACISSRHVARFENLGGEVYVGPKIWGGASSKGGAKIWGGGGTPPCLPPSNMPFFRASNSNIESLMHSSPVSLCKGTNCMLVYAGVNCFEDRNETKEKFRVAKVLYITCSTWLNFLFHSIISFIFRRKFNFVLQVKSDWAN